MTNTSLFPETDAWFDNPDVWTETTRTDALIALRNADAEHGLTQDHRQQAADLVVRLRQLKEPVLGPLGLTAQAL
jgi:hypothetical protein